MSPLEHHNKVHEDRKPPFFKCDFCPFYDPIDRVIRQHSLMHHEADYFPFKCKLCPQKKKTLHSFQSHLKTCQKMSKVVKNRPKKTKKVKSCQKVAKVS